MRAKEPAQSLKTETQMGKKKCRERMQTDLKTSEWGGKEELCANLTGVQLALLLRGRCGVIYDGQNDTVDACWEYFW